MAASICRNKVVGNKLGAGSRFRCFVTTINRRALFGEPQTNSLISENNYRCIGMFPDPELKYYNGVSLHSEVMFPNKILTYSTCCKISQGKINNILYLSNSSNSRFYENRKSEVSHSIRNYSNEKGPPRKSLPSLMEFPELVWPSVIKTVRNWILANLIITPYFDQEFRLPDFIFGSKQAVECVSGCLSKGDYEALHGLVSEDSLGEVKKNIATFSVQQRQLLAVSKEDIYFSFPYQIGVMFNDDDKNQQRFVEITMVYHTLQGLKELTEQGTTPPLNMGMMPEYRDKIHICNYRFIREFTKGVESDWSVNVLNHFKPVDYSSA